MDKHESRDTVVEELTLSWISLQESYLVFLVRIKERPLWPCQGETECETLQTLFQTKAYSPGERILPEQSSFQVGERNSCPLQPSYFPVSLAGRNYRGKDFKAIN